MRTKTRLGVFIVVLLAAAFAFAPLATATPRPTPTVKACHICEEEDAARAAAALAFLKEHFKGKARQLLEGG